MGSCCAVRNVFTRSPCPQTIIAGKPFESFLIRYLGFGVEPLGKQSQLIRRNLARTDSVEEMM